jgi:peptide methionine sulfoxide reductase MsrB
MRKTLEAEMEKSGNDVKSDEEWRKTLTPEEFRVTREHGTERAFSHPQSTEQQSQNRDAAGQFNDPHSTSNGNASE